LFRGVLGFCFQHLKEKPKEQKKTKKSSKAKEGEKATDAQMSWPRNLQEQLPEDAKSKKKKDAATPFPFEVETM
jgi:hypothetical protein